MAEGERSRTPFVETELLLAVLEENWDRADELVAGMLPNEKRRLQGQLVDAASILLYGHVPAGLRGT